jgi:23S rRNA-/tRNA-specific pseudouridylate synthase
MSEVEEQGEDDRMLARKTPDGTDDLRNPPLPLDFKIPVVYRDEEILVVNKPYDIRIDGKFSVTVEKLVRIGLGIQMDKFRLCNQLDAATSGIMVMGLSQNGAGNCGKLFVQRKTEKFYLAVGQGFCTHAINIPIHVTAKIFEPKDGDFKMYIDEEKGKESETVVIPIATNLKLASQEGPVGTLFLVKLLTGRRHQIRLHLKHIGYPIVGDATYGDRPAGVNRMMLHAWKLVLPYSETKRISLTARPEDICQEYGMSLSYLEDCFIRLNNEYFRVNMESILPSSDLPCS